LPDRSPSQALAEGLAVLGIDLSQQQQAQFAGFLALLERWNRAYNLTAVRDPGQMISLHLLDSLTVLPFMPRAGRLADLGSGAGLPGIPLAIARPGLQLMLVDSNSKKSAFQRQVVLELGLPNVEVINARVEKLGNNRRVEAVISRALATLAQMVEWALPMVVPGGDLFAMKGAYPRDELHELPPGVELAGVRRLEIPGTAAERHLVHLRRLRTIEDAAQV